MKKFVKPVVGLVVVLWFWGLFSVKKIKIVGLKQIDATSLTTLTEQALHQRFWTNNLLTLDTGGLSGQLVASEPRLKSVTIKRQWTSGLIVAVEEKQPTMWWQTSQLYYLLDRDGSIIGLADSRKPLVTVVDSANLPVKVGDRVVPPGFMSFCTDLLQQLPARTGIAVTGLKVPDTTSEVYVTTNKGYLIKFDTTRPAAEQVDDLVNVLGVLVKSKKTPAEYIDLRIEHKAYYR